jgi:hypothetical protein
MEFVGLAVVCILGGIWLFRMLIRFLRLIVLFFAVIVFGGILIIGSC